MTRVRLGSVSYLNARPCVRDHGIEVLGRPLNRANSLAKIFRRWLALLVDQPGGAVCQDPDTLRRDARLARRDTGIADRVGEVWCPLRQDVRRLFDILQDVGKGVLIAIRKQLGQPLGQALDAVDQFRRGVQQRAQATGTGGNHRASLRAHLRQRLAALNRALQGDFADTGESDALDLSGGALEDRRFRIDLDPDPDEFRPIRQQTDLFDLANGNTLVSVT